MSGKIGLPTVVKINNVQTYSVATNRSPRSTVTKTNDGLLESRNSTESVRHNLTNSLLLGYNPAFDVAFVNNTIDNLHKPTEKI